MEYLILGIRAKPLYNAVIEFMSEPFCKGVVIANSMFSY